MRILLKKREMQYIIKGNVFALNPNFSAFIKKGEKNEKNYCIVNVCRSFHIRSCVNRMR